MDPRAFISHIQDTKDKNLGKRLMMMDIIEYGRIIHAEMNAITDAARNGVQLEGTTLYCTTFPCHLCAKHIISSGINRVVYIEPYPKSYATELYEGDIKLTRSSKIKSGEIYFEPFIGISPVKYRDFFEKGKRKDKNGDFQEWCGIVPKPILNVTGTEYIDKESEHMKIMILRFAEVKRENESK